MMSVWTYVTEVVYAGVVCSPAAPVTMDMKENSVSVSYQILVLLHHVKARSHAL